MFGISRNKPAKKKHGVAYYILGSFTLAIEFMLGVNAAFLVDQSMQIVTHNMLAGTSFDPLAALVALVCALGVGLLFVTGGLWTFGGFMDSVEDARAYQDEYGTSWPWPVTAVCILLAVVIAVDFFTLLFRAAYFAEKGGLALFLFFVVLIPAPFFLGLLMHVLEHTPRDRRLSKINDYAVSVSTQNTEQAIKSMDPDLLEQWVGGDPRALQEHYTRVDQTRTSNYNYEQEKIRERDEKRAKRQRHPLLKAVPSNQANGNSNQRGA